MFGFIPNIAQNIKGWINGFSKVKPHGLIYHTKAIRTSILKNQGCCFIINHLVVYLLLHPSNLFKLYLMKTNLLKFVVTVHALFLGNHLTNAQCANSSNIYSFSYDGRTYEIVKENKTWTDAAACAVERGGILAEINDVNEQNALFNELSSNAGITNSNTIAPDGGGGAYVWIGGNDLAIEGNWVWDGNNDGTQAQFWMGTYTGSPVGGLYNNWGDEPDDYFGQDALGLSLNGWPLGFAGQWNDLNDSNALYFMIEHPSSLNVEGFKLDKALKLYPNPVNDYLTIEDPYSVLVEIKILTLSGQEVMTASVEPLLSHTIDLSRLGKGVYLVELKSNAGESFIKKLVK